MRGALALALLLTTQAYAMPPEPGSDDELAIRGYEQWITQMQTKDGGLCCSIADGRVVADSELRVRDGRWEVLYSHRHWGDAATEQWLPILPDAIQPSPNPVGLPVVWIWHGQVRCASLGPQT